jgi:Flp pilus assembly protein TadB
VAARLGGGTSERLAADLAVLDRTPTRHVLDKLGYAVLFFALALVPAVLFPVLDIGVPAVTSLLGAVLFAAAGWLYPDVEVRSRARAARRAWAQALTVYVDIVGISLAGGAGVEDALMVAGQAGSGPQFERLDATLRAAQTRRGKLWHALDQLGTQADILPLRELASAVDLAAESGSRIRETLLAKANAMRVRQLTEVEADAQKASETMGIAPALMAIAAVVLIGYPALARFLAG